MLVDPRSAYPRPPFPKQQQPMPGKTALLNPRPDHGEETYAGHGKLKDCVALITGADSGIGRAVAIAFAREGADVVIAYLNEHDDAKETARWVEKAGRRALLIAGDISEDAHCQRLVKETAAQLGRFDILVNNAAFQATHEELEDLTAEEINHTFKTNIEAMFLLSKYALAHMKPGASIINTSSINAKSPNAELLAYATTKGAIANFTVGLAQLVAKKGIRANAVAPGPVWTPLIPSTMDADKVSHFGENTPLGRPAQPAELAPAYVFLASNDSSYITGAVLPVTGGRPML